MDFSEALYHLKSGAKLAREIWTGSGPLDFIFKVDGSEFDVNRKPLLGILPEGTHIKYRPHLDMYYVDGTVGVWTPTQFDIFADDWMIV
jgi:hypothetical protein